LSVHERQRTRRRRRLGARTGLTSCGPRARRLLGGAQPAGGKEHGEAEQSQRQAAHGDPPEFDNPVVAHMTQLARARLQPLCGSTKTRRRDDTKEGWNSFLLHFPFVSSRLRVFVLPGTDRKQVFAAVRRGVLSIWIARPIQDPEVVRKREER